MPEKKPKAEEKSGVKWLLDSRNAFMLQIALLAREFDRIPPITDALPEPGKHTFTDYKGSVVTFERSQKFGYKIVTWTKPCEAIISDTFAGFSVFSKAKKEDIRSR